MFVLQSPLLNDDPHNCHTVSLALCLRPQKLSVPFWEGDLRAVF